MKKNYIKVMIITISALLCSHLWAQGSESTGSEIDRQFETSYAIRVNTGINDSMKVYILGLTSENGSTRITNGFQPSEGYTAFFVCDDNTYLKYDYENDNIWESCSTDEEKCLKNIYNKVLNRNVVFTTESNQSLIDDTSYIEINESELDEIDEVNHRKFLRTKNNGFSNLTVYNKRKGVFVYAVKIPNKSKVHVISFRDKSSIAEIKPDNVDENIFYNNYKEWLASSYENKEKDPNVAAYKMLSVLVYDTLKKSMKKANGHFANLYNDDSNMVIRKYLQLAMENNRNVYFSEFEANYNPLVAKYNPLIADKLETVTEDDRLKIANEAKKYIDHSIEKKGKSYDKNFIQIIIDWLTNNSGKEADEYFDNSGKVGYGLPYIENGFDTPRTFNQKIIKNNSAVGGCDDIGFLNGVLYSSNIKTYVPINKLDRFYSDYIKSISNSTYYGADGQLISLNDLNKISMLVSDVTEAEIGDIVVFEAINTTLNGNIVSGSQNKKKIGIIVETGKCNQRYGENQKDSLGDLTVVWMNEEKGAEEAKLSKIWSTDDGFVVPKFTEIRRILKDGKSTKVNTNWNVYDNKITDTSVEINWMHETTQVSGEQFRWIPNTGEYLSLEKIKFHAYNQLGVSVKGNSWRVYLSGAIDRDWKEGDTQGNVYNNSDCKFDIQLGDKTGILQKNSTDKSRYDISWTNSNSVYGPEFIIESDNLLYYYDFSMTYGVKRPVELRIRPESSAAARPGDDLLLEFTLREINTNKKITITVPANNYIAVYDKKMLWRANLYLNKPEDVLGGEDWNNAHPWNAPNSDSYDSTVWFGKNEWNTANGGQCEIKDWTAFYNSNVSNSVAYGYGCGDEVKEFNDGLSAQSSAMMSMNDNNEAYPPEGTTFSNGQTTAPGHQWENYIFPADTSKYEFGGKKLLGKEPSDFFKSSATEEKVRIPGFSAYWKKLNEYDYSQCSYTLGIDCSGLVHRCSLYLNTKYKTIDDSIHNINAAKFISTYSTSIQSDKWVLEVKDSDSNSTLRNQQRQLLEHAIPGDILVVSDENLELHHVVLIQNLNYTLSSELITDYSQVDIIHSTQGGKTQSNQWNVQKGDWNELGDNKIRYKLRRLIIKD